MSMTNFLTDPARPYGKDVDVNGVPLMEFRLDLGPAEALFYVQGMCSLLCKIFHCDDNSALLLDGDDRDGLTFITGLCADILGNLPPFISTATPKEKEL